MLALGACGWNEMAQTHCLEWFPDGGTERWWTCAGEQITWRLKTHAPIKSRM